MTGWHLLPLRSEFNSSYCVTRIKHIERSFALPNEPID